MANITSFLSEGFLKEFIETIPSDFFADEFLASVALYRFLDKHSGIILSGNKEDYADSVQTEQTDGLVRNLIDKYLQGEESVQFNNWEKSQSDLEAKPFSFFFLASSKNSLKGQLDQKGLPSYQLKDIKALKQITGYEAIPVTNNPNFSNRLNSWGDLKNKLLPFHSLLIVDNYLFANPWQTESAISMVENLLPFNPVDITFIYFEESYKDYKDKNIPKIHTWDEIKKLLSNSKSKSLANASVVKLNSRSNFHDRVIITNSQFITSGNSFNNYFGANGIAKLQSPTILNLNSHACIYNDTKWSEIASQMLKTIKGLVSKSSTTKIGTPLTNPLLT